MGLLNRKIINIINFKRFALLVLPLLVQINLKAESISVTLSGIKKPSSDLISTEGIVLSSEEAAQLALKGYDISTLDPQPNRFWQPSTDKGFDTNLTPEASYYPAESVDFVDHEITGLPLYYMGFVQNKNIKYRMTLSRFSHAAMIRASLLKELGYYQPLPKYYKKLKIKFSSLELMEAFITQAEQSTLSDFTDRKWIVSKDQNQKTLTLSHVVLEPIQTEYFDLHWGFAPDPKIAAQRNIIERYSKTRAFRALIVPFMLVDIPESINRYSPLGASLLSDHVVFYHPSAEAFGAATKEDIKWILAKIAKLSQPQINQIIGQAQLPQSLHDLVVAKFISRSNQLFSLFGMDEKLNSPTQLDLTSKDEIVISGKVVKEWVEGYPVRFSHGDRQSPINDDDFLRYLQVRGISAAIATTLSEITKKLEVFTFQDTVNDRISTIQNRITEHVKKSPDQPLYQKVEAWGGPVGGFQVSAARHITSGSYYQSQAPIQMVDNLTVGANLGYFMLVDGVDKILPQASANVMVVRDYTHVRPLLSVEEGAKVSWTQLVVPFFNKGLVKSLSLPTDTAEFTGYDLDEVIKNLREGEIFTVTDSLVAGGSLGVSSSFDVLFGFSPLTFLNKISLSVDSSRIFLKQTSIAKTASGLQFFVRGQNSTVNGANLDVHYYLKVLNARYQNQNTMINTDAFVVDYDPELQLQNDNTKTLKQSLTVVLHDLLKLNSTDSLYKKFKYQKFKFEHDLKTSSYQFKFLAHRLLGFTEDHTLVAQYPEVKDRPDLKPEDEQITLFAHRKGELMGVDLLGFFTDIVESILNNKFAKTQWDLAGIPSSNPANTPFGNAYWRLVRVETDLSPKPLYQSVGVIEHVWSGWHISQSSLQDLIAEIKNQFEMNDKSFQLIEKEKFMLVKSMDFYKIAAIFSVLPTGVTKIEALLKDVKSTYNLNKKNWVEGFFSEVSKKMGNGNSSNEPLIVDKIAKILGAGNLDLGYQKISHMCQEEFEKSNSDGAFPVRGVWRNGQNYECLTGWLEELLDLSQKKPISKKEQAKWVSQVLSILEKNIPTRLLMSFLDESDYLFVIRFNGFRTGDEDGDLEVFSNTYGSPKQDIPYANGLMSDLSRRTRVLPVEIDRSQGGFN